jgi:hypothetical protein
VNPTRRRCTRAVITFTLPGPCCRLRSVSVSVCQCGKHVEVWIMCPIVGPISTPPDHQGSLGLIKSHQISSVLISAHQCSSVLIRAHIRAPPGSRACECEQRARLDASASY